MAELWERYDANQDELWTKKVLSQLATFSAESAAVRAGALSKKFLPVVYNGIDLDEDRDVRRPEFT